MSDEEKDDILDQEIPQKYRELFFRKAEISNHEILKRILLRREWLEEFGEALGQQSELAELDDELERLMVFAPPKGSKHKRKAPPEDRWKSLAHGGADLIKRQQIAYAAARVWISDKASRKVSLKNSTPGELKTSIALVEAICRIHSKSPSLADIIPLIERVRVAYEKVEQRNDWDKVPGRLVDSLEFRLMS